MLDGNWLDYKWVVETVIRKMRTPYWDREEERQDGMLGLWLASQKYDGRGNFLPFAWDRVKWAIQDGMRTRDYSRRRRAEDRDRRDKQPLSFNIPLSNAADNNLVLGDVISDPVDRFEEIDDEEEAAWVREFANRVLPKRELVVINTKLNGGTLADAADILGVTESRASQIYKEAVRRMAVSLKTRQRYEERNDDGSNN